MFVHLIFDTKMLIIVKSKTNWDICNTIVSYIKSKPTHSIGENHSIAKNESTNTKRSGDLTSSFYIRNYSAFI